MASFLPQIQGIRQIQYFHNKNRTLNCRVWVNKINNNILSLNNRRTQSKKKNTIQVKVRSEKVFLYLERASTKIPESRTRYPFNMSEGANKIRQRQTRSAFLRASGFNGRARPPNLKFIIGEIFPLFSSILSELFFPPVISPLFTSTWMKQDKFEYT